MRSERTGCSPAWFWMTMLWGVRRDSPRSRRTACRPGATGSGSPDRRWTRAPVHARPLPRPRGGTSPAGGWRTYRGRVRRQRDRPSQDVSPRGIQVFLDRLAPLSSATSSFSGRESPMSVCSFMQAASLADGFVISEKHGSTAALSWKDAIKPKKHTVTGDSRDTRPDIPGRGFATSGRVLCGQFERPLWDWRFAPSH